MPLFLYIQGRYHLALWYVNGGVPSIWQVKTTANGWIDNATGLDWLKHFDKYTKARQIGGYRILVLDGHKSYINAEFEEYIVKYNIIYLYLPLYLSYLTQPLNIIVYILLKKAYGAVISILVWIYIIYITKDDFFIAFKIAFEEVFTKSNILGSFYKYKIHKLKIYLIYI